MMMKSALRLVVRKNADDDDAAPEIDLEKVDLQTHRLLHSTAVLALVVGLFLVWADVFPALQFFKDVTLWTDAERNMAVSLADLLEAAAVAAAYAFLVAALWYRNITLRDTYQAVLNSSRATASIGMLIAGALVFNYVITVENIPKALAAALKAYELSPLAFLLFANLVLLVLGCFLEGTTILLIIVPVLLPTAQALGIDPVHFGVVAVVNIMIGLVTPPYGLLLFMMTKIADVPLRDIVREAMPFLYVMFAALALIMLVPDTVLLLPRMMGYKG
jgi:tripartite ATP-independent transporter DctM subunit